MPFSQADAARRLNKLLSSVPVELPPQKASTLQDELLTFLCTDTPGHKFLPGGGTWSALSVKALGFDGGAAGLIRTTPAILTSDIDLVGDAFGG